MVGMPSVGERTCVSARVLDALSKQFVYVGPEQERRDLVYSRSVPFQARAGIQTCRISQHITNSFKPFIFQISCSHPRLDMVDLF